MTINQYQRERARVMTYLRTGRDDLAAQQSAYKQRSAERTPSFTDVLSAMLAGTWDYAAARKQMEAKIRRARGFERARNDQDGERLSTRQSALIDEMRKQTALDRVRGEVKRLMAIQRERPRVPHVSARIASPSAKQSAPMGVLATLRDVAPALVGEGAAAGMVPVAGYLAVFGNEDTSGDIIEPGAFTQTIEQLRARQQQLGSKFLMPILWGHDPNYPIGGWTALEEDKTGLFALGLIDPNVQQGHDALEALDKGYACGLSIGYFTQKSTFDGLGRRHLKELAIFEGSVTPLPANQLAVVTRVN